MDAISTLSVQIGAGNNDGTVYDTFLEVAATTLGLDNAVSPRSNIYLRFTGITIPQGATISACTVTLIGDASSNGIVAEFYCSQEDNAASLSVGEVVGDRSWGTLGANTWSIPALSSGTSYTTPDVSDVVQAIINRGGWSSGNSLLFRLGINSTGGKGSSRSFRSYDHGSSPKLAQIDITYTTSAGARVVSSTSIIG